MSKIEVNQISSQCGSTLTIGQSGDTVTLASGATQSGFGRTGTVDWDTTAKTASFTAVSGNGYFVNTTSGAITLTLPATPSAGDIVAFKDYAFTFATNNLTVDGNGSPIGGVDGTINPTYNTNGTSKTFIYVDGTKGWLVTNESTDTSQESNALYVTATGGTVLTCGDYKTHVFTADGCFAVSCAGNPTGSDTFDYVVIAGGASGGIGRGGGAGAGGFRLSNFYSIPAPTMSPLANPTGITASAQTYPITVGGGGAGLAVPSPVGNQGNPGSNSIFSTITSAGGGGGANSACAGGSGGSGGGVAYAGPGTPGSAGSGNTPPTSPPQGQPGGTSTASGSPTPTPQRAGGAGGGAGGAGGNSSPSVFGKGGLGSYVSDSFFGPTAPSYGTAGPVSSVRYFAGGGGASAQDGTGGAAPDGGGGTAGKGTTASCNATANTGGGSGGSGEANPGSASGNGGSGIVMIRYKFQN